MSRAPSQHTLSTKKLVAGVVVSICVTALLATGVIPGTSAIAGSHRPHLFAPGLRFPGVGVRTVLYLDRSRPTYDYLTGKDLPGRRILTEIRYPSSAQTSSEIPGGPVALRATPYPVIVFAEGYRARPDLYVRLLDAWVHAGYVVVSPEFPDTTYPKTDPPIDADYPYGSPENDLVNEPADIAFVLGDLAQFSQRPTSFLHGLVDLGRVILSGQSDGAAVVDAYVFDSRYSLDRRPIRAVAVFAGYVISQDATLYREPTTGVIPALVVQSAADTCNEPYLSVQLYNSITGTKFFLKIMGATHLGPFDGSDRQGFAAVRNMSLRFFSHVLSPGTTSLPAVIKAGSLSGVAYADDASTVPSIPTPIGSPYCAPAY